MSDQSRDMAVAGDASAEDGTAFGRYRLIELLGRGGMGEVWRAFDTATERRVAVKVLPEDLSHDAKFQERFRREALAAASLNSPHVIPIHNHGEIDGRLYVDMRLVEGRDLETVLADGPLDPGRAVRIVEQVARALHAAHKIGLVHRDVKPSNILIAEDDFAYLIDFGIARATGEVGLTGTNAFIGSWHYMAPERFSGNEADARVDVYALACVLYECLTGQRLYPGESLERQYFGHVSTPPPKPSSVNPSVPSSFDRVTARGLAKDPAQRYASTVEFARAASEASTDPIPRPALPVPPVQPPPAPRPQQAWRPPPVPQHRPAPPPVPQHRPAPPPDRVTQQRPPPAPSPPQLREPVRRPAAPSAPIPASVAREILSLEILLGAVSLFFLCFFTAYAVHDGGTDLVLVVVLWWAGTIAMLLDVVRRIRRQRRNRGG